MHIANIPIVDFYEYCLPSAKARGFKWVVTLLARKDDIDSLYDNLKRAWDSLDDITGRDFLFIFAGKEQKRYPDYGQGVIDRQTGTLLHNKFLYIINEDTNLESPQNQPYNWRAKKDVDSEDIAINQTKVVSDLRDYFNLAEKEIPCLVFTSLFSAPHNKDNIIIPVSGNEPYQYFKELIEKIHPYLRPTSRVISMSDNYEISRKLRKIDEIIRSSIMDHNYEKPESRQGDTFNIYGGINQLNTGEVTNPKQYVNPDATQVLSCISQISGDLHKYGFFENESVKINENLNIIKEQVQQEKPQKTLIDKALKVLETITKSVDFVNAITTLASLISRFLG